MTVDFSRARIAIIGDFMVDEYWHCTADRISPEAPVAVCNYARKEHRPGGAGNVLTNCDKLGAQASGGWPIICEQHRKLRIVVGKHQLSRVDFVPEAEDYASAWRDPQILDMLGRMIAANEVVVVSDYGRMPEDVVRSVIKDAKAARQYVLVDPKRPDASLYSGAHFLTPNTKELMAMAGTLHSGAKIIETRGAEGIRLHHSQSHFVDFPTVARDVIDVTGAGDTVVATLACAIGSGYPLEQAVHLANVAAGIACEHFGTYAVTIDELNRRLEHG